MSCLDPLQPILAHYPLAANPAITGGDNAGGFSGARIWKLTTPHESFCVRRWPAEHPDEARLRFMHGALDAAASLPFVPKLLRTFRGETAVFHAGHWWEVTTWMPGVADFHEHPSAARLNAAMQALRKLHDAWRPKQVFDENSGYAVSPGIAERSQRLEELVALVPQLRAKNLSAAAPFRNRAGSILDQFERLTPLVRWHLRETAHLRVPLQPCLRDIWHDHVLFTGEEVTGIIDYGAMRIESVVADIARLVSSLIGDEHEAYQYALEAYYGDDLPLPAESKLLEAFDLSTLVLGAMNWLDWILLEGRTFNDMPRIEARLDEMVERMRRRRLRV